MRTLMLAFTCLAASAAFAQDQRLSPDVTDARWVPWLGCWRPSEQRSPEEGAHICVVPGGDAGVRVMTLAGDQAVVEETVIADGIARELKETNCTGTRRAEWSRDGERFFSAAELTCDNEPARTITGLTLISDRGEWLDVQVVRIAGRESVRVRRYTRSGDQPPEGALSSDLLARAAQTRGTPLAIDDIIEAKGKVSSRAIEAALLETNATFRLDRRSLLAMDDAGVPKNVIDLMVALSYPRHFEVRRSSSASFSSAWPGVGFADWDWFGFDPFYSYYAFFSPFGYRYYPYWDYYGNGGGVIVEPPPDSGDHVGPHGRVVNGAGYTQVTTRPPEASVPRGSGGNDGSSGASDGSASASSGSSATSSGYSSGGGGDTGHTAVPR